MWLTPFSEKRREKKGRKKDSIVHLLHPVVHNPQGTTELSLWFYLLSVCFYGGCIL